MASGYKLLWTDIALKDLKNIISFLSEKWSEKEIRNFARKLDKRLNVTAPRYGELLNEIFLIPEVPLGTRYL